MVRFCIVGLIVCSSIVSTAQQSPHGSNLGTRKECPSSTTTQALRQVIDDWKAGYNDGDPDRIASLYTPDAIYLTQHYAKGIVSGRAEIKAYFKNGTDAGYKVDSIDILRLDCDGQVAYAITRYESTNGGQKAFGFNLVVLKNAGGKWWIVAHESAVPEPTAIQTLKVEATR